MKNNSVSIEKLLSLNETLQNQLAEAEETLEAFRDGLVDAVVVSEKNSDKVYTMRSADYMYRMLVENMREGAVTLTSDGTLMYANRHFARIMNLPLEQLVGSSIFDFVPQLQIKYFSSLIKHASKEGSFGESELIKASGEHIPVYVSASSFNSDGATALCMIFTDLSHLKLAEIIEFSEDAIFRKTLDGIIITWNKGAQKIFKYAPHEIIGCSAHMIFPPGDEGDHKKLMTRIKNGERIPPFETKGLKKGGKEIFVSLTLSPIADPSGRIIGASTIARNITKEKQLELQKDALIGIASHELKTPVTTIKSYAQILGVYLQQKKEEKPIQYISKLEAQADRITELINDLLDVSRMEAGKLELMRERFNLSELIREIIADLQQVEKKKVIVFENKITQTIRADRHRISQVIINLIGNAIKYSPRGDKIIVRVLSDKQSVGMTVEDFGIGISQKDLKKLFNRFFQADTKMKRGGSGLGLGLYISKEIIQRHEGEIWVESKKGQGSVFGFRIPSNFKA